MKATRGSKVYLKVPGVEKQWFTVVFVAPHSLRLKRANGTTVDVSRNKIRFQLGLPPSPKIRVISTPMGGKPRGR